LPEFAVGSESPFMQLLLVDGACSKTHHRCTSDVLASSEIQRCTLLQILV